MDPEIEKLRIENEQLKKQIAAKSDHMSISAHQLRTSLSAIKWILKMFLDGDFGPLTPEQSGFMKKAFDSNERMLVLVGEMLSFNHADDTPPAYDFQKHDLVALIDNVLFDFTGETYKKGVGVIFLKPETSLPEITYDEEKIRVVIQNLVENAIKYSSKGDKVIISARPTDSGGIEASVKDTGIGIPEAEQGKIFGKLFRASNATIKEDCTGTGLGLYTTKRIVEEHGGTITFESKENGGTTFTITLPRSPK